MKFTKITSGIALVGVLAFCTAGTDSCDDTPTSQQIQNAAQEQLNREAVAAVPLPNIVNWREKHVMKDILEDRDRGVSTITYAQDLAGKLHKVCDSIGYPIPGGTQFTPPEVARWNGQGGVTLPQEDPNGLYSPASSEGTYVMCQNPKNPNEVKPVYYEPRWVTSPFPLANVVD